MEATQPAHEPGPEELALDRDRRLLVQKALMSLEKRHREVLLLLEYGGLSYQEIAQTLGLSQGTVKSRLSRARRALRETLLADGNLWAESPSNHKEGGMAP